MEPYLPHTLVLCAHAHNWHHICEGHQQHMSKLYDITQMQDMHGGVSSIELYSFVFATDAITATNYDWWKAELISDQNFKNHSDVSSNLYTAHKFFCSNWGYLFECTCN